MNKKKLYLVFFFVLAGGIPALLWANVFTGPLVTQNRNTILTSDLNGQYISYMMYFRSCILSGKSLSYSFSSLLGNNMAGLAGYYMMSPLNLITLIFPAEEISRAVYWIILCKTALAGISSAWLLGRKRKYSLTVLLFSTTYALSGYSFAYYMHLMWMDSVVLLPVCAIGIEKLVNEKKSLFYAAWLSAALILCYYTGYMSAGFCLLYFLFLLLEKKRSGKENRKLILKYLCSTALAGLLSAIVLVPALLSQGSGNAAMHSMDNPDEPFVNVLAGFFMGRASSSQFHYGSPHLYIGMLMLFLVLLYLIPHKKEQRRSSVSALMIVILYTASLCFGKLDLAWHLFSQPHGFTHRYVFCFILFLLILAERSFSERLQYLNWKETVWIDAVLSGIALIVSVFSRESFSLAYMALDIISLILISVLLAMSVKWKGQKKRSAGIVLMAVQVCVLSINGFAWQSFRTFDDHSSDGYYEKYSPVIAAVESSDPDFYRMEKTFLESENDAMLLGYNGLTFYSSAGHESSQFLLGRLGYSRNYMWSGYGSGGSLAGDSFLGVRYLISNEPIQDYSGSLYQQMDDTYIYENKDALPAGFLSSGKTGELELGDDVFENQQKIYSSILNEDIRLFNMQDESSAEITEVHASRTGNGKDGWVLSKTEENGYVRYQFHAPSSGKQYLYLYDTNLNGVQLSVNGGKKISYATVENHSILPLGTFNQGEEIAIDFYPGEKALSFHSMEEAALNQNVLDSAAEKIQNNGWKVLEYEENHISADISFSENALLLTTIPYDEGWKIKVDGKTVEGEKVLGDLLAFPLSEGTHTVEMNYRTPGLGIGAAGTGAGILLVLILWKREKEDYNRQEGA